MGIEVIVGNRCMYIISEDVPYAPIEVPMDAELYYVGESVNCYFGR